MSGVTTTEQTYAYTLELRDTICRSCVIASCKARHSGDASSQSDNAAQPGSGVEPLPTPTAISDSSAQGYPNCDHVSSNTGQSDHTDVNNGSAPPSAASTTTPTPTHVLSSLDKWQIRLNVTQVVLGALALLVVFVMLRPQVADHHLNQMSLKLSQWTAWKDFRDDCRSSIAEARHVAADCKTVLDEPLAVPPVSIDARLRDRTLEFNATLVIARKAASLQNSLPVSDEQKITSRIAILITLLVLLVAIITTVRAALRSLFAVAGNPLTEMNAQPTAWVPSSVPRLSTSIKIAYTSGYDTAYQAVYRRSRNKLIDYPLDSWSTNASEPPIGTSEKPEPIATETWVPLLSELYEGEGTTSTASAKDDDFEGGAVEDIWVPIGTGDESDECIEHESTTQSLDIASVELVLKRLCALGHNKIALGFIRDDQDLRDYFKRDRDHASADGFLHYVEDQVGFEDASVALNVLLTVFDTLSSEDCGEAWCIKMQNLSLQSAVTASTLSGQQLHWRLWQADSPSVRISHKPCLYILGSAAFRGKTHLIFKHVSTSQYHQIVPVIARNSELVTSVCEPPEETIESNVGVLETLFSYQEQRCLEDYAKSTTELSGGLELRGHFEKADAITKCSLVPPIKESASDSELATSSQAQSRSEQLREPSDIPPRDSLPSGPMTRSRSKHDRAKMRELAKHHFAYRSYVGDDPVPASRSRASVSHKISRLSLVQCHEMSTDLFDELQRRQAFMQEDLQNVPPLPARPEFHMKRNEARQKLALLRLSWFRMLCNDVSWDLERRFARFLDKQASGDLSPMRLLPRDSPEPINESGVGGIEG